MDPSIAQRKSEGQPRNRVRFAAILPIVALLGCASQENPDKPLPLSPLVPATVNLAGRDYLCTNAEAKIARSSGICITDCSLEGAPFNYTATVLVADCSKEGEYHKFVYTEDGSKALWEGIGNSKIRAFVGADYGKYTIKVVKPYGNGWITDFVSTDNVQKIWLDCVKAVFNVNKKKE